MEFASEKEYCMRSFASQTIRGVLAFILLVSMLSLTTGRGLSASTYTVNDAGDTGDAKPGDNICKNSAGKCTLRAAIQEAVAHPGVDNISIPAMTIIVHKELAILYKKGDDQGVIINGAGQSKTIIDGNNETRVFFFGQLTSHLHAISNLTIRNANNKNTEPVRGRMGGAIFNEGWLTLTNVTLTKGTAYKGGGIYQHRPGTTDMPKLFLNNVTISYNTATATDRGAGGGGLANGSVISGNKVYINNNLARRQGGGFYNNSYQQVTLTSFQINNNTSYIGGGIMNDIGPITLTSGTLNNNLAPCCLPVLADGIKNHAAGGAIDNNYGVMTLTRVQIAGNRVLEPAGLGGGITNINKMVLNRVSVTGNKATYGAGIYNSGNVGSYVNSLTMTNTTISGNIGYDTTNPVYTSLGGGIFNKGYIKSVNNTIANNTAYMGGGIEYRGPSPSMDIFNTILANNTGKLKGPNCHTDTGLKITSDGRNVFGSPTGCSLLITTGDQINKDAMLEPLTGFPPYHRLRSGSPATDKGTNTGCPATDVIGTARPQNKVCDVGAFEYIP
jgi:hypothetical protein